MSNTLEFGIDLGTTNSCVARCEGDTVRIFQNNDLMNVTPSAVRIMKNNRVIVGKRAHNAVIEDPANVAVEFKRSMGRKEKAKFPASGREASPEELSAEVLKALREDVQRATGQALNSAVITVPAAFGSLQCQSTSTAAKLAGIDQSQLLQEPIAAAIAYGVSASSRDQRWLVYDLGGGTLDIAVVSTREGSLTVLEHRGNNLLGGKDIDRLLVLSALLPPLTAQFRLPDPDRDPEQYQQLLRRLAIRAEEAKIELSSREESIVALFDMGEDLDRKAIELEVPVSRKQLERITEPLIRKTLGLADEALAAARLAGRDLDRVLLVGGPTQMPFLRLALQEHLNARVDHSLDPMTVVARGAAVFAATVEIEKTHHVPTAQPGAVQLKLAYQSVSASTKATIAGKVVSSGGAGPIELRMESKAGYWNSGWSPIRADFFELDVQLQEGKVCPFFIYVRSTNGDSLEVEPSEFVIRHGLELSAPPLPHTISVEVVRPSGRIELDPIFPRNTPLPAEKHVEYRADRTLRPGEPGTALVVKLWEGEDLTDPEANEWVGNVQVTSEMIRRPVPENKELELFVKIDTSRLITVDIFVPHLNQHFSEGVYIPEHEQQAETDVARRLINDISTLTDRLIVLHEHIDQKPNSDFEAAFTNLRREVQDFDMAVEASKDRDETRDTEEARRLVATGRDLRNQVAALERRAGIDRYLIARGLAAQKTLDGVLEVVEKCGDTVNKFEFEMLKKELERAAQRHDERGVAKCVADLETLQFRVLEKHDWFWREMFESMGAEGVSFNNATAARRCLDEGEAAIREGDGATLRKSVRALWALASPTSIEIARRKALRPGIRS
jgi:molecular chaperone DnaK